MIGQLTFFRRVVLFRPKALKKLTKPEEEREIFFSGRVDAVCMLCFWAVTASRVRRRFVSSSYFSFSLVIGKHGHLFLFDLGASLFLSVER